MKKYIRCGQINLDKFESITKYILKKLYTPEYCTWDYDFIGDVFSMPEIVFVLFYKPTYNSILEYRISPHNFLIFDDYKNDIAAYINTDTKSLGDKYIESLGNKKDSTIKKKYKF